MSNLVLLGDSIFDNARYVPGEPCVREQVEEALPSGWQVTLLALDGATTRGIARQVDEIPADASHLVLSLGGNDALQASLRLRGVCSSFPEAMQTLAEIRDTFLENYRIALDVVMSHRLPTMICTVYDRIPGLGRGDRAGLALFNELILREAVSRKISVIDLRLVCDRASDYSRISPIEPSAEGGAKIAAAIARAVTAQGNPLARIRIWV